MTTDYPTLLLAGKRRGIDPVADERGVAFKAIAPLAGRPMIAWVLGSLDQSASAGPVYISTSDPAAIRDHADLGNFGNIREVQASTGSICRSVQKMLADTDLKPPFLLTTADNPLLTPAMIDHFWTETQKLGSAANGGPDLVVGIVPENLFRRDYPDVRRTFIKCRGEGFKSCNMFAFLTPDSLRILDFWGTVEQDRKNPLKIARAFGFGNLLRYVLRLDDTDGLLKRVGKILGVKAAPVRMTVPEVAFDVDSVADLHAVEAMLIASMAKGKAA